MIEITQQRLTVLISAALAIVALLLYGFLYAPLIGKLREAALRTKSAEAKVLTVRNQVSSLKMSTEAKRFIKEEEAASAIDEFTRLGKSKGISFIALVRKPVEQVPGAPYRLLPIEVSIESSYEALGVFLGALDKLEKSLVTVGNSRVVPSEPNPEILKTQLAVNMHLAPLSDAK